MTTLPAPFPATAILSFDFDGTLRHPGEEPPVPLAFFAIIRRLREEQAIVWGINTGRTLEQTIEGLVESSFPFLPDWIVAREREIYFPDAHGQWQPESPWNERCEAEIHALFSRSQDLLARLRHEIEINTGARWIELDGEPAGVIAQTDEEMEWIVAHIGPLTRGEPDFAWQQNSIYLRFGHRDFQKGSSLSHLAAHYQLPVDRCFAAGDSYNDLEMLDPANAGMTACPTNAIAAVREKVRANGGFLAPASHGHGAIAALQHYFLTP